VDLKDRGWKGEDWIVGALEQDRWLSAVNMLTLWRRNFLLNFSTPCI
jgi:hypothetical protein